MIRVISLTATEQISAPPLELYQMHPNEQNHWLIVNSHHLPMANKTCVAFLKRNRCWSDFQNPIILVFETNNCCTFGWTCVHHLVWSTYILKNCPPQNSITVLTSSKKHFFFWRRKMKLNTGLSGPRGRERGSEGERERLKGKDFVRTS